MLIIFYILNYFFWTKILLCLLILTTNRYLHKLKLTKSNLFFDLMILDNLILVFFLYKNNQWIFFLALQTFFNLIIFNSLKNYNLIGLTGTIGSGKSTLIKMIKNKNKEIGIIDCDYLTHDLFNKIWFIKFLKIIFKSRDIYKENDRKVIERKKIGNIIFNPENKFLKLKYLCFVNIQLCCGILKNIFFQFCLEKKKIVIIDAPILFETKILTYICFPICTIYVADDNVVLERISKRNPEMSVEEIKTRINLQMPSKVKIKNSDFSIENVKKIQDLYETFILNMISY